MPRKPTVGLTPRQRETLRWIKAFLARHGLPPTVNEAAKGLRVKKSTAFYLLRTLKIKGYLRQGRLGPRSLKLGVKAMSISDGASLVRDGDPAATYEANGGVGDTAAVPILGSVAAGPLNVAEEHRVGDVLIDRRLASRGKCFALEVRGNSMVGAGIKAGDVVIVLQQPVAQHGDIIVGLLGDEATVKELSIQGDRIELKPRNPGHRPIPVGPDDDFRILGKVISAAPGHGPHIKRRD